MKIYVIREECAPEFRLVDGFLSIHLMLSNAQKKLKRLKKERPYEYQYLEIHEGFLRK